MVHKSPQGSLKAIKSLMGSKRPAKISGVPEVYKSPYWPQKVLGGTSWSKWVHKGPRKSKSAQVREGPHVTLKVSHFFESHRECF